MGNLNLTQETSREKALIIFGYLHDVAEVKINKLKDPEVIKHIWDLAVNKDDSRMKKILKKRAAELNLALVG